VANDRAHGTTEAWQRAAEQKEKQGSHSLALPERVERPNALAKLQGLHHNRERSQHQKRGLVSFSDR
jgi:hypothetical protein